jgi:hypothetical protein
LIAAAKKRLSLILLILGIVLTLVSFLVGIIWFVAGFKLKQLAVYEETYQFSEHQYRDALDGMEINHDKLLIIGRFGNKKTVERIISWLISHNKHKSTEGSLCTFYHCLKPLAEITNQPNIKTFAGWVEWWEKNSDKTQEEWIKSGFNARGIKPGDPVSKNDVITLLKLLAKDTDKITTLKLNCYRWLRFKDYERLLKSFKYSDIAEKDRAEVFKGLRNYTYILNSYTYSACINPFIKEGEIQGIERPNVFKPFNVFLISTGIILSFLLGIGLIIYSRKRAKSCNPMEI